jgi:predicted branched-subunit amino acid permease
MNSITRSDLLQGMRDSLPVVVAAAPFGLLYGALAIDSGLSLTETVMMSVFIYAGASQTVAPWLVVLSIFAVKFRHVLYSAAVGRHIASFSPLRKAVAFFFLIDPQYAETENRAELGRPISFAWYMGMALPVYVFWVAESLLGGLFGSLISDPQALGIDFFLPVYFLALVMGFRGRTHWLPVVATSALASIVAYHFVGSPWHVSLGAIAGIAIAAMMAGGGQRPMIDAAADGMAEPSTGRNA